jgi:hypothetical protein
MQNILGFIEATMSHFYTYIHTLSLIMYLSTNSGKNLL